MSVKIKIELLDNAEPDAEMVFVTTLVLEGATPSVSVMFDVKVPPAPFEAIEDTVVNVGMVYGLLPSVLEGATELED